MQRLVLRMPDDFRFRAGQYLEVVHPRGSIPLSIASAPRRLPELHLHYRSSAGAPEAVLMDELLAQHDALNVRGPAGDVMLASDERRPVLLVAGGTGIAQARSLLEDHAAGPDPAPVTLLWCADQDSDFYLRDELAAWSEWLEAVLIADPDRSAGNRGLAWLRGRGAATAAAAAAGAVVIAGNPAFVYAASDVLTAAGVASRDIQSDVFSYAPRPQAPRGPRA